MQLSAAIPAAAVLIFLVAPAGAQTSDCAKAQTQLDLNECAAKGFKAADADLNAAYRKAAARLAGNADALKLLTVAQRNWIAFRDSECAFASSSVAGGTIYPMVLMNCRERVTRARIADFKTYLACQEGDVGCPLPPQ